MKLATYYLSAGADAKARVIAAHMVCESSEFLRSICHELGRATSPHFWEIIDRGRNLEYLPEIQRLQLPVFLDLPSSVLRGRQAI